MSMSCGHSSVTSKMLSVQIKIPRYLNVSKSGVFVVQSPLIGCCVMALLGNNVFVEKERKSLHFCH